MWNNYICCKMHFWLGAFETSPLFRGRILKSEVGGGENEGDREYNNVDGAASVAGRSYKVV